MQSESSLIQNQTFHKLRQLGFQEKNIVRALEITQSLQTASQILIKLAQEGPDVDLSSYKKRHLQQKMQPKPAQIHVSPFSRAKMLFIVNAQLKMGKGKICAQVGHAVIGAAIQIQEEAKYDQRARNRLQNWQTWGTAKIVVKCDTQKQMLAIKKKLQGLDIGINTYMVQDAGHTQIKAGSKTVLGVGPAYPEEIDPITKHLKLL